MPSKAQDKLIALSSDAGPDKLIAIFRELPPENQKILGELILHFNRVSVHSDINKMTSANMAIILAPNLFDYGSGDVFKKMAQGECIALLLLKSADLILG